MPSSRLWKRATRCWRLGASLAITNQRPSSSLRLLTTTLMPLDRLTSTLKASGERGSSTVHAVSTGTDWPRKTMASMDTGEVASALASDRRSLVAAVVSTSPADGLRHMTSFSCSGVLLWLATSADGVTETSREPRRDALRSVLRAKLLVRTGSSVGCSRSARPPSSNIAELVVSTLLRLRSALCMAVRFSFSFRAR